MVASLREAVKNIYLWRSARKRAQRCGR